MRRWFGLVITVLCMTVITFFLTQMIPGDPARAAAGPEASAETIATIREEMGLDKPVVVQYGMYMARLFRGDLGRSIATRRPVFDDIRKKLPASIELAVFSALFWLPLGLVLGVLCAVQAGSWIDLVSRAFSILGVSLPVFWVALLIQLLLGKALPIAGRIDIALSYQFELRTGIYLFDTLTQGSLPSFLSVLSHLVMPALTLTIASTARLGRMVRSCVLEVLRAEYITTARSKGLSERTVLFKHALRNALIPIITIIGLQLADLIAWVFLVETVFAWPGIGRYGVTAIFNLDHPAIIGTVLTISCIYVGANFIVDLLYMAANPQVRYT